MWSINPFKCHVIIKGHFIGAQGWSNVMASCQGHVWQLSVRCFYTLRVQVPKQFELRFFI